MTESCEPPIPDPHPHQHAHIVGRIRRHGTARLARRMHQHRSACLADHAPHFRAVLVRGAATVGAIAALNAAPSTSASGDPDRTMQTSHGPGSLRLSTPGGPVGVPTDIPEPSSLAMLLVAALAWTGMRMVYWRQARPVSPG